MTEQRNREYGGLREEQWSELFIKPKARNGARRAREKQIEGEMPNSRDGIGQVIVYHSLESGCFPLGGKAPGFPPSNFQSLTPDKTLRYPLDSVAISSYEQTSAATSQNVPRRKGAVSSHLSRKRDRLS